MSRPEEAKDWTAEAAKDEEDSARGEFWDKNCDDEFVVGCLQVLFCCLQCRAQVACCWCWENYKAWPSP